MPNAVPHGPGRNRRGVLASLLAVLVAATCAVSIAVTADPVAADFVPLDAPARLIDTRPGGSTIDGDLAGGGVRPSGSVTRVRVAGRAGVPPDATTAVLNVTAVDARSQGYLTLYPCDPTPPNASTLNYGAGQTIANAAISALTPDGDVCIYNFGDTDLIVDVSGQLSTDSFTPLASPKRLLDSRAGGSTVDGSFAGIGVRPAGSTLALEVAGRAGVPLGATSVALNVTVADAREEGYVTVFPCGQPLPNSSNLNYGAGVTIANAVVTGLDGAGAVCFFTFGAVDLIVDVTGAVPSGAFASLPAPRRLLDTRSGAATFDGSFAGIGVRPADQTLELRVGGRADIPANASAVILNVTAVAPQAQGYVTIHPAPTSRPNASTLNFDAGATIANLAIVKVGAEGDICLYNSAATHLVVDVAGWLTGPAPPGTTEGCPFTPVTLLDPPNISPFPFQLPCNAGPALDDIPRVQINPGIKPYLDNIDAYLSGDNLFRLAYTVMANSGPLPAAVARYREFTHWIDNATRFQGIDSRADFISALNLAYHETLHVVTRVNCFQTGPDTGILIDPNAGPLQSETWADVRSRIDAFEAGSSDPLAEFEADYARSVADNYLKPGEDIAAQPVASHVTETVSYVLSAEWGIAMNDLFGVAYLGTAAANETTMNIKMHQVYRYLNLASTRPEEWAELRAGNLPSAFAQYWNLAARLWRVYDPTPHARQLHWDLFYGPDVAAMVTYTDGAAGTTAPPRP